METAVLTNECLFCDRLCPECGREAHGFWEHKHTPQPKGGSHVVYSEVRVERPLAEILSMYFDHVRHSQAIWQQGRQMGEQAAAIVTGFMRIWGWT